MAYRVIEEPSMIPHRFPSDLSQVLTLRELTLVLARTTMSVNFKSVTDVPGRRHSALRVIGVRAAEFSRGTCRSFDRSV